MQEQTNDTATQSPQCIIVIVSLFIYVEYLKIKVNNKNKIVFRAKVELDHPWTRYTGALLLLLWPWPWPDDLDVRTWPGDSKDVSEQQRWTF